MKKFGRFCFSFVPVLYAFAAQLMATCFIYGIIYLIVSFENKSFMDFITFASNQNIMSLIMILYSLLVAVPFIFWYQWKYKGNLLAQPKTFLHPLKLIACIVIVPGVQFLASYVMSGIALIYPKSLEQYTDLLKNAGLTGDIGIVMILYSVVFAPIAEEFLFRGITMRSFRKILPFWIANILQALLFGIFHMNLIQGAYAFLLGLFLGYFCERGGSIYYSILIHFLFNLWGVFVSSNLPGLSSLPETLQVLLIFGILVVSITLGLFFLYLGRKKQPVEENPFHRQKYAGNNLPAYQNQYQLQENGYTQQGYNHHDYTRQ